MTSATSRARSTRWVSPGASRASVRGSIRARSALSFPSPSAASRSRNASCTSGSPGGIGLIPKNSARR